MRNLFALIGAAIVLFAGLGWYLGWYTFALEPSANGKQRIQLDVDTDKMTDDVGKFGKTVGSAVQGTQGRPVEGQAGRVRRPAVAAGHADPPGADRHPAHAGPVQPADDGR